MVDILPLDYWNEWRQFYHQILARLTQAEMDDIYQRMQRVNPKVSLVRPVIESVWEPITNEDDWEPFYDLVRRIQGSK